MDTNTNMGTVLGLLVVDKVAVIYLYWTCMTVNIVSLNFGKIEKNYKTIFCNRFIPIQETNISTYFFSFFMS